MEVLGAGCYFLPITKVRHYAFSKSGLWAAFLILLATWLLGASVAYARPSEEIYEDPVWHALLHLRNGEPQIKDHNFLLSLKRFTPENELNATIAYLQGPSSQEAICRFPARAQWLHERGLINKISTSHCHDWQEFLQRAPADEISLVFT